MRVTTVIKDYITREIEKKYREKLAQFPNDYKEDYNKMIDEIDVVVKDCDKKVKEIAKKYNMLDSDSKNLNIVSYASYCLGNNQRLEKRRKLEKEFREQRDNKIADIILSLELGETTKKELADLLNNIQL